MKNSYSQNQTKKKNSFFTSLWKVTLLVMMLWTSNSFGQLLSENFEGGFPAGWTRTNNTGFRWGIVSNASGYGIGIKSARMDFYDIQSGSEQMNTLQFTATTSGYYLVFDEAYAAYPGGFDDQLQINYSTDGGATWNQLILLDGGDAGPLNTGGDDLNPFVPAANQWQTFNYSLPVGTNMIQFNGISAFGNELYVDNVQVIQACSGTPVAGAATSATSSTCPFTNFTVTLSGADNTPGLTYQWQSSTDNIVYNDMSGETARELTTNETASSWYQCVVTCSNSGLTATSSPFEVTVDVSTLPLLQDFEGGSFPDQCFSESFNTAYPWSHASASAYGLGSFSAKMDFWDISSGSEQLTSSQFTPTTSGYVLRFDEAYATAFNSDDELQVLYSTDGGATFTQLDLLDGGDAGPLNTGGDITGGPFIPSAGQWQTLSYNLPLGTNMVQFNGISAFGNNLYLDNVHVFIPVPCSGTPVAGTAISFSNPVGQNVQFLLALSGADNTDGLTYQWQSSPDNIVYTDIPGAIYPTLTTSGTADTWYHCVVTCSNSGQYAASVPVFEQEHLAFTWTPVSTLAPHNNFGVMLLLSDGSVLCKSGAGGNTGIGNIFDRLTPDINGSYINGTWSSIAPMIRERYSFSSEILKDGRVYAAGGEYGTDGVQAGSHGETYDPLTDTWTACVGPGQVMSDGNTTILDNGNVIQAIVDHFEPTSTVIYTPSTNTYTTGPSTNSGTNESMWLKLPDNSILFVDEGQLTSERYIPSLNQWIVDSDVPVELYDLTGFECGPGFLLPDGRAFFIGSTNTSAFYTPSGTTDPGTWTTGPSIPNGLGMPDAPGSTLTNGNILFACSHAPEVGNEFPAPTYFYEFDYLTNTFTQINAPTGNTTFNIISQQSNLVNLPNGQVLCGINQDVSSAQYYVFTPSGTPLDAGKPTISNIIQTSCNTYTITGNGFNGIDEGSAFGDENQDNSNYPLVRLTSGSNVYYARTHDWNSTGVQRGNLPDTTYFTLPNGIPAGTYNLVVTANGNASDPISIYVGLPATPGAISGNATPCYNSTQTYSVTPVAGANSYIWTTPIGWVGTSTTNSITVTVLNVSGNVTVRAVNICGNTVASVLATTVMHTTAQPGVISGPTSACVGSTQTYSVAPVVGATGYSWILPSGWTGTSTTNSITVTVGNVSQNVTVQADNGCGLSAGRSLFVTVQNVPLTPGQITGPSSVCSGNSYTYSIAPVVGATSYYWTTPAGWTGTSSTTSLTVLTSNTSGNVSVLSINNCGSSVSYRTLAVSVGSAPAQPGLISGNANPCSGPQNYSVAPVAGATSYQWITPLGWTGTSSTSVITVVVNNISGNIKVRAINSCGVSTYSSLAVTVSHIPSQPGTISGNSPVCQGTSQTYSVSPVIGATSYVWTKPSGWTGTSTSNSLTSTVSATSGNVTVMAVNSCGSSPAQTLAVAVNTVSPVTISGNPVNYNFCSQVSPTSEILTASPGYSSYSWSPSGGNMYTATVSSVNTFTVTATAANGCTTTASKAVTNNCAAPTSLSTNTITGTSAKANWIQSQCAVNYTLQISTDQINWTNSTVTGSNHTFSGLSLSTTYYWRIETNCTSSDSVNSGWTAALSFTTLSQRLPEEGNLAVPFNVYPNPADEAVTIAFSTMQEGAYNIKLIDMLGRTVKSEIANAGLGENTYIMNLDGIAKGIYTVTLQQGDNISKAKLVVE